MPQHNESASEPRSVAGEVRQGVEAAFEAMQIGRAIAEGGASAWPRPFGSDRRHKEQEMSEAKLGWFDRLLIKIAVVKATARGHNADNAAINALSAFGRISAVSSRTSQSDVREAQR